MPAKGYKLTLKQKKDISRRMKERWANPTPAMLTQLKTLHESLKGRKFTPEWRKKISIAMIGNKNQEKKHSQLTKQKIAKAHKKLWKDPKRRSGLFTHEGRYESPEHYEIKQKVKNILLKEGFNVDLEYPLNLENQLYITDVFAQRNNEVVLIECGNCPTKKLKALRSKFPKVFHLNYSQWRSRLDTMKIEVTR